MGPCAVKFHGSLSFNWKKAEGINMELPGGKPPLVLPKREAGQVVQGQLLSHYRLEAQVGIGGLGTVFRAIDTRRDRMVAIKVLHSAFQESGVARFVQGERARARLTHPAIADIYQIATKPLPFIAMEWIDGMNFDSYLKKISAAGSRDMVRITNLLTQAAEILAVIHNAHIVHGDIKPSNLMVDRWGRVHLMDLGLARLLEFEGGPKKVNQAYMAPEQADSRAYGVVDHQTDVYALGLLLYECLAGRFPYRTGPAQDLLQDVLLKDPDPPASGWPELDAVCLKALAKDKSERYSNVEDFKGALAAWKPQSERLAC